MPLFQRTSPRLSHFHWKGINPSGQPVAGQMLAAGENEVREQLHYQQIRIIHIRKRRLSSVTRIRHSATSKDITRFIRQLSVMLLAGMPLIQALKLLENSQTKAGMKQILMQIVRQAEAGTPLSKAMCNASIYFTGLTAELVTSGEQSGRLAEAFDQLATYREKSEALRAKVIKAMIYPGMVMLVASGVSWLMLTLVIPEFESMFQGMGAELPWFTRQVLTLSDWVQNHSLIILITIASTYLCIMYRRNTSAVFRLQTSRWALRIPIIGNILSRAAIARFSRTLSVSFSAGIPLLTSLMNTAGSAGNQHYEQAIHRVHKETASGVPMHIAMRNSRAFPELVLQMIRIGEESGKLDEMLNNIAAVYEAEVDNYVDNLGKIIEPLIILFLGTVVGGLVISMYLPIFNLMTVLG
ncbi:type II secretion system protein F [Vibrio sp. HA2012]|uniref:type II secretion system F family protein n=1 Tax=Vibrio sp. HA2012 TaxID=1971595 RepID=UPI000C2B8BA1|nr:type II secretion system F family protein [Vibrio sp. HA2012]PJC86386.1 type II secretion system protein F [Vibrio sp. HA2012]